MQFACFVMLTALVFLRPGELIPELRGLPIYQGMILACMVLSLDGILRQLSMPSLRKHPITFCVAGLMIAVVLSHLSHLQLRLMVESADFFFRNFVFYFVLVATVNSPGRFRSYLLWLVILISVLATISLMNYHGVIEVPGFETYHQRELDPATGQVIIIERLCGVGSIFNDPNDFSLILAMGMLTCAYLGSTSGGLFGLLYLTPIPAMLYTLAQTHSRGGLLTLAASLLGYLGSRFGLKKALPLLALSAPLAAVLFSGRQTDIKLSGGTGQDRVHLWREGFELFRQTPLFGIGMDQYGERVGLVAHNSFVHAYVELGIFGGTLFLSIFVFTLRTLYGLQGDPVLTRDKRLSQARDLLTGIFAAFTMGFFSLSRCYVVTTYLIFGLAAAYFGLIQDKRSREVETIRGQVLLRYCGYSLVALTALYLFLRVAP